MWWTPEANLTCGRFGECKVCSHLSARSSFISIYTTLLKIEWMIHEVFVTPLMTHLWLKLDSLWLNPSSETTNSLLNYWQTVQVTCVLTGSFGFIAPVHSQEIWPSSVLHQFSVFFGLPETLCAWVRVEDLECGRFCLNAASVNIDFPDWYLFIMWFIECIMTDELLSKLWICILFFPSSVFHVDLWASEMQSYEWWLVSSLCVCLCHLLLSWAVSETLFILILRLLHFQKVSVLQILTEITRNIRWRSAIPP